MGAIMSLYSGDINMSADMLRKVENLYKNARVIIPSRDIKAFVDKYGENAYDLALGIIRQPSDIAKELEVSSMGSKGLTYVMIKNDFSEYELNKVLQAIKNYEPVEKVQTVPLNGMIEVKNPELNYAEMVPDASVEEIERINGKADRAVNRAFSGMYPSNKVAYVNRLRKEDFVTNFPVISREGKTDEEYLNALADQYVKMKNEQFKYAYKQAGLSGYVTGRCCSKAERQEITCNGTEQKVGNVVDNRLEYIQPEESAFIAYNGRFGADMDCAASTARQVIYASTINMGTYGNNDIFEGNKGYAGAYYSHQWMEIIHGDEYSNASENGENSKNLPSQKTLKAYLDEGVMDIGSTFSVESGGSNSGFHYMSVVDVVRNEKNEVISYTISDHNGGGNTQNDRLIVCPPDKRFDNQHVIYTLNQNIKDAEFKNNVADVLKIQPIEKAIEQMEKMVNTTRFEVVSDGGLLDRLASTEHEVLFGEKWKKHCGNVRLSNLKNEQKAYNEAYFARYDPLIKEDLRRDETNFGYRMLANEREYDRIRIENQERQQAQMLASIHATVSQSANEHNILMRNSDIWDDVVDGKVDMAKLGNLASIDKSYINALGIYKAQKGIKDDDPQWKSFTAMCNNIVFANSENIRDNMIEGDAKGSNSYEPTKNDEKFWQNIVNGKVKDLSKIDFSQITNISAYAHAAREFMDTSILDDEKKARWSAFLTICESAAVVQKSNVGDDKQVETPVTEGQEQTATIVDRQDVKSAMSSDFDAVNAINPKDMALLYTATGSNNYEGLPEYMKWAYDNAETILPQLLETYTVSSGQSVGESMRNSANRELVYPVTTESFIAAYQGEVSRDKTSEIDMMAVYQNMHGRRA